MEQASMARSSAAAVRLLTGEREPVRLATTASIAFFGLQTIDGVATEVGDRVLVKDQADQTQNGIYTVSEGRWFRAADARTGRTMQKGTTVHVQQGNASADFVFAFQTLNPVIGADDIVLSFYQSDDTVGDIQAAAQGIIDRAQAAADVATGAMTTVLDPQFATKATAEAYSPPIAPTYIRTAFYDSSQVAGSGAVYRKNGTNAGDLVITLSDGMMKTGYTLASTPVTASMLGARGGGANATAAIGALLAGSYPHVLIDGSYQTDGNHTISTAKKRVECLGGSALILRTPVGTVTAHHPVIDIAADDVLIDGDLTIDGGSHAGYQASIGIRVGLSTGARRKRPTIRGVKVRNLGLAGVMALCVDSPTIEDIDGYNIVTPTGGEFGDTVYVAGVRKPIVRNIRSAKCKRDGVVLTYTGNLNTTDVLVDGVFADAHLDSPSAGVWVEMTGARDPRGIITNVVANDCLVGVAATDANSEIVISNVKAIGNRLSGSSAGNVFGVQIQSGRLDNWYIDRYNTALQLEPNGEYQFALSSQVGSFATGETVSGGTSGSTGTLRFQHFEILITGSTVDYELGETVTGGSSGATGILVDFFASVLRVLPISGTFQAAETITGGTSAVAKTANSATRRIYVRGSAGIFPAGETITGGTSGATAVIAAPYQTPLAIGPGTLMNCSTDAIVVANVVTPASLSLSGIRGNTQSHGIRFNLSVGQRLRKASLRDIALKNSTSIGIAFRVTTGGAIDEMLVDGFDMSEWVGDGTGSSITAGIVTRFIGGNNPGLQGTSSVPINLTVNTTLSGLHNRALCHNNGAGATWTHTLPPAVPGLRIGFAGVHATHVMNIEPNGTDTIKGGGAGKYLILDPGERVTLEAYATGSWVVSATVGWAGDFEL
ncbi:hypothetical protein [Mesorhizobium sp. M0715]|uniref:hypothetical protein n=1 Tax=Mesorhizobium sp. M0715 TaxID=2956990 RepID=UPI003335DFFC